MQDPVYVRVALKDCSQGLEVPDVDGLKLKLPLSPEPVEVLRRGLSDQIVDHND
jgi:hypothetical protein